jgi:large subunit ribosomal protein L23
MALFGKKDSKKTEETTDVVGAEASDKTKDEKKAPVLKETNSQTYSVLKKPRITEKATDATGMSMYTFEVSTDATKSEISKAVQALYNVKPVKIRTVMLPAKRVNRRGKIGMKSAQKKAYVHLKKGEHIEIL